MMKKSIILSFLIGSAALCCMNGCVPVMVVGAAGVGYGWVNGEYKVAVDHDVISTYDAAIEALKFKHMYFNQAQQSPVFWIPVK